MAVNEKSPMSKTKSGSFHANLASKQNITPKKTVSNELAARINHFLQHAGQKEKTQENRHLPLKEIPSLNQVDLTRCTRSGSDVTTSGREPETVVIKRSSSSTSIADKYQPQSDRHFRRTVSSDFDRTYIRHSKRRRTRTFDGFTNRQIENANPHTKRMRPKSLERELILSLNQKSDTPSDCTVLVKRRRSSGIFGSTDSVASSGGSGTSKELYYNGVDNQSFNRVASLIEKWKQVEQESTTVTDTNGPITSPKYKTVTSPPVRDVKIREHLTSQLIQTYEKLPKSPVCLKSPCFNTEPSKIRSSSGSKVLKSHLPIKHSSPQLENGTEKKSNEIVCAEIITNDDPSHNSTNVNTDVVGVNNESITTSANWETDTGTHDSGKIGKTIGKIGSLSQKLPKLVENYKTDNSDKSVASSYVTPVANGTDKEHVLVIGHTKVLGLSAEQPCVELCESKTDLSDTQDGSTESHEIRLRDGLRTSDTGNRDSVILFDNIDIGESSDDILCSDDKNGITLEISGKSDELCFVVDNESDKENNDPCDHTSSLDNLNIFDNASSPSNVDDTFIRLFRNEDKNEAFNRSIIDQNQNEEDVVLENKEIITSDDDDIGRPVSPYRALDLDLELSVFSEDNTSPKRETNPQKARRSRSVSPKQRFSFGQNKSQDSDRVILSDEGEDNDRNLRSKSKGHRQLHQSLSADSLDPRHTVVDPLQPGYPILHSRSWDQVDRKVYSRPRVHFEDDVSFNSGKKKKVPTATLR